MKKIFTAFSTLVFTLLVTVSPNNAHAAKKAIATLAGGCFWCVESTFEKLPGVKKAVSGYTGGTTKNPTYQQVGKGGTGHTEAVQIYYDPSQISYEALLYYFWREIDPTDNQGQFADRGEEYRPAIFYHNEQEREIAIASKKALEASSRFNDPVVVEILPLKKFYKAERYHQNYYRKNPGRYKLYRAGSGRDRFLRRVWGEDLKKPYVDTVEFSNTYIDDGESYVKPDDNVLKAKLNKVQYGVTQEDRTERRFENKYWNNKNKGIYVDVVSKEPLFSSTTKFRSGTGWPSFSRPIDDKYIVEKIDKKLLADRVEVRSRYGDSHLGHVFADGPKPTGLRYCINSASLEFVPLEQLQSRGYSKYLSLFEDA